MFKEKVLKILCLNGFKFHSIDVNQRLVWGIPISYFDSFGVCLLLGWENVAGCGHWSGWIEIK